MEAVWYSTVYNAGNSLYLYKRWNTWLHEENGNNKNDKYQTLMLN